MIQVGVFCVHKPGFLMPGQIFIVSMTTFNTVFLHVYYKCYVLNFT